MYKSHSSFGPFCSSMSLISWASVSFIYINKEAPFRLKKISTKSICNNCTNSLNTIFQEKTGPKKDVKLICLPACPIQIAYRYEVIDPHIDE